MCLSENVICGKNDVLHDDRFPIHGLLRMKLKIVKKEKLNFGRLWSHPAVVGVAVFGPKRAWAIELLM